MIGARAARRVRPRETMNAAAFDASPAADGAARRARILALVVLAAIVFNFVLCFVNANIFRTSAAVVMLAEVVLVAIALFIAAGARTLDLSMILLVFLAYMVLLGALQGGFDPKPARDIVIPLVFYFAALRAGSPRMGDRIVTAAVAIVLVVGLFEYLFLKQYTKYFDILGYYISRGSVHSAAAELAGGDRLFASGMRYEGRTLRPFLGEHRVSSVFLEPVSVGNFGAICFAWIVLRHWRRPAQMALRLVPVLAVFVFADARFGLTVSLLSLLIFPLARFVGRPLLALTPLLVVLGLATAGFLYPDTAWDNTTRGRLLLSGQMLSNLSPMEAFALVRTDRFVSDSGYVYTFVKIGAAGFFMLWALYSFAPAASSASWRFRVFIAAYITLLLTISNSIYSIKTAALAWYLVGALDAPGAIRALRRPRPVHAADAAGDGGRLAPARRLAP